VEEVGLEREGAEEVEVPTEGGAEHRVDDDTPGEIDEEAVDEVETQEMEEDDEVSNEDRMAAKYAFPRDCTT
jgi:hypothetical protein